MTDALSTISTRRTAQSEQADKRQVPNSAGGWTFTASDVARLHRFLTLGTDGGTFYVKERPLTKDSARFVIELAERDPHTVVAETVRISMAGRAPRNKAALFALAIAASVGSEAGRQEALAALPLVARTGTHLMQFCKYAEQFRGWGRAMARAVGAWYLDKDIEDVCYQVLKYRQRVGWTHRDLLRLAHPYRKDLHQEGSAEHRELLKWLTRHDADLSGLPLVEAFQAARKDNTLAGWLAFINREDLPFAHEMLPPEMETRPEIWRTLLEYPRKLPLEALLRELNRLTWLDVIGPADVAATGLVCGRLTDAERIVKARLHPVKILIGMKTYAQGHGEKGDKTWSPVTQVIDALDDAFYKAFGAVEPAGKRTLVALDVSGSMTWRADPLPLMRSEITGAMSMVTVRTEPQALVMGFADQFRDLGVSPRQRLDDVVRQMTRNSFGSTDCALPMIWAARNKVEIDHFTVFTDNETWFGQIHPHQALRAYREGMGIDARQSVVAIEATPFTIADPDDPGTMDVCGFDAQVPQLLANFARGGI